MRRILFIIAISTLLLSCNRKHVTRKTSGSQEIQKSFEDSKLVVQFVDTTKREDLEVVYTKVEYYPPGTDTSYTLPSRHGENDAATPKANKSAKEQSYHPPPEGAVKSVETFTIKRKREDLGKSEVVNYSETKADTFLAWKTEASEITKVAKDPYRWRYIFYILLILLVAGLFFWIRKKFSIVE